ncbi:hypothetical protein [Candidatus Methylacidithermus pantelleriae]|uniref:Uncharacterized protein n=1 Tax=Candidatus Methylacidithermus pantelleriae TaxID=2744239 RepID=A0A8J2BRY8_9BACT|nr:hypothetical protein [Candidatus Methylacidithermus pantelleriae]CAF0693588.1 hypothetical protein MPNT_140052 [Candidatus Methylacidithermus pantelleriae]
MSHPTDRFPHRFPLFDPWLTRREQRLILFLLALTLAGGMMGLVRDRLFPPQCTLPDQVKDQPLTP